jgi:hypothetical protein
MAFVHEMNHAQNHNERTEADVTNPNRAAYVDSELREEAHGDALANQSARELRDDGVPLTNSAQNQAAYDRGYQKGVDDARAADPHLSPQDADAAGRRAGEQAVLDDYRAGRVKTSNTNQPYPQYYGNRWDNHHPAAGGGGD